MTYSIYSNSGVIDTVNAPAGYTLDRYLRECHDNGCIYEDENELYMVCTDALEVADRLLAIDPHEAMDTETDRDAIIKSLESDPLTIIRYLLDIIDELQA